MGCGASSHAGLSTDDRRQADGARPALRKPWRLSAVSIASQPSTTASSFGPPPDSTKRANGHRASQDVKEAWPETVVRDEDPLAAVSKGVTLRGLRRLRQLIQSHFGEERFKTATTADVTSQWVQSVTASYKCRVAEMRTLVRREDVGVPYYFISHAWKNRFEALVSAVEENLAAAGEETAVWIDIFAVNQHGDTHYQSRDVGAFKDVVRAAAGGTLVVMGDDLNTSNPATRAWCIYEWAATLATHGSDGLLMALSAANRGRVVRELDVEKAECFKPGDKTYILGDVVAQHGSTAAFNHKLKLQLMLEPLSYTVDLHRIHSHGPQASVSAAASNGAIGSRSHSAAAAAASPTSPADSLWDWAQVEAWARGATCPPDSMPPAGGAAAAGASVAALQGGTATCSRVLCITGGPGEGKSTIATELLSDDGPLSRACGEGRRNDAAGLSGEISPAGAGAGSPSALPNGSPVGGIRGKSSTAAAGLVIAQHFFKYSDQRRQEPVRVIKSLAFQLALKLPAVRDALLQLDAAAIAVLRQDDVKRAFDTLLMRPLMAHAAQASPQPVVIVLDGLDEADPPEQGVPDYEQGHSRQQPVANGAATHASESERGPNASPGAVPRIRGNSGLTLLTEHLCRLPPGLVRFVVTTRPEAAAGQVVPSLLRTFGAVAAAGTAGGAPVTPSPVVQLTVGQLRRKTAVNGAANPGSSRANAGDGGAGDYGGVLLCRTIAQICLESTNPPAAAAGRQKKAAASPRTQTPASECAEAGRDGTLQDLNNMYGKIVTTAFASYGGDRTKLREATTLLGVLLAAQEPLTESFLERLRLGRTALDLLPGSGRLFFSHEHRIYLAHRTLADFLRNPNRQQAAPATEPPVPGSGPHGSHAPAPAPTVAATAAASFPVLSPAAGHWAIARQLIRDELASPSPSSYCLRYAVHHLAAALAAPPGAIGAAAAGPDDDSAFGGNRPAELLDRVLSDFAFLARVCASGNGPRVIDALGAVPAGRHTKISYDALRWLRTTLNDGSRGGGDGGAVTAGAGSGSGTQVDSQLDTAGALARTVLFAVPVTSPLQDLAAETRSQRWCTTRVLPWRPPHRGWSTLSLTLRGHSAEAGAVAWSPDGRQLLSGGADGLIRVWDAVTAACTAVLAGHGGPLRCLRWGPDGRQVASGSRDQTVRIWDAATGQTTAVLLTGDTYGMAWSPGGQMLATVGTGATGVFLWDTATGACVGLLQGHASWVWSVAWRPDGGALASGGADGMVRLWDVKTGQQLLAPLEGHSADVNSVAWSPDGRRLVSGGSDSTVRQWDVASGKLLGAVMRGHTDAVMAVEWCPLAAAADANAGPAGAGPGSGRSRLGGGSGGPAKGRGTQGLASGDWIISGSCDRTVRLWSAADGSCMAVLEGAVAARVTAVAWRPDGSQVAAAAVDGAVRVWDVIAAAAEGAATASPRRHGERPGKAAVVANGGVAGSCPQTPNPTPAPTPSPVATPASGPRVGVCWSPDGKLLAGGCDGSTVGVWDADAGECVAVLYGHTFDVSCVCWSPDGRRLASSGGDETVRVWDLATRSCVLTIQEPQSEARIQGQAVGHSATPSQGGSEAQQPVLQPHIWDDKLAAAPPLAGGGGAGASAPPFGITELVPYLGPMAGPPLVAALPAAPPGLAEVLDLTAPPPSGMASPLGMASPPTLESQSWGWVFCVAWSPDGGRLATASGDGAVRIFDAKAGSCTAVLRGHVGAALRVAWSPDGRRLASCGSDDGAVRIWDAQAGPHPSSTCGGSDGAGDRGGGCLKVLQVANSVSGAGAAGGGGMVPYGVVSHVAWSPDGHRLVCNDTGGAVRMWDAESGTCTASLQGHAGAVYGVAWCPTRGNLLASGGDDGTVRIWELSGEATARAVVGAARAGAAAASGAGAGAAPGWASSARCVEVLEGHTRAVEGIAWHPNGRRLASGSADRTVRIWDWEPPGAAGRR